MNKCKRKFDLRKCKLMITAGLQWMKRWKKGGGGLIVLRRYRTKKLDKK